MPAKVRSPSRDRVALEAHRQRRRGGRHRVVGVVGPDRLSSLASSSGSSPAKIDALAQGHLAVGVGPAAVRHPPRAAAEVDAAQAPPRRRCRRRRRRFPGWRRSAASRAGSRRSRRGGRGGRASTLSSTAHSGAKASESSSWKLEHSQTTVASAATSPTSEARGVPTLPATATGSAAVRQTWPRSSVTVVLPFVPVTATKRFGISRQASSSSPTTGVPRSRAAATTGASRGNSGALDQAADAFEQIDAIRSRWTSTPAPPRSSAPAESPIAARHLLSTAGQEAGGGLTRARQADDQVGAAGKGRSRLRHASRLCHLRRPTRRALDPAIGGKRCIRDRPATLRPRTLRRWSSGTACSRSRHTPQR